MNELHHRYCVFIAAPPETVWRAIADPAWTARYFHGTRIESALTPGAPFAYRMEDGTAAINGSIQECVPGRRLVQLWHAHFGPDYSNDPPSTVTWELEPTADGGTKLTLTHAGFPDENATFRSVADGWMHVLLGLKRTAEAQLVAA